MNGKKCDNCVIYKSCEFNGLCRKGKCATWIRNPRMWLSIPPEKDGWYWWRTPASQAIGIKRIFKNAKGEVFVEGIFNSQDELVLVSELGGQWQGPITPEG